MSEMPSDIYLTMKPVANSERTIRQVANSDWSMKTKEAAFLEEKSFIASFHEYLRDYLTVIFAYAYEKAGFLDHAKSCRSSLPVYFSVRP